MGSHLMEETVPEPALWPICIVIYFTPLVPSDESIWVPLKACCLSVFLFPSPLFITMNKKKGDVTRLLLISISLLLCAYLCACAHMTLKCRCPTCVSVAVVCKLVILFVLIKMRKIKDVCTKAYGTRADKEYCGLDLFFALNNLSHHVWQMSYFPSKLKC